MSKGGSLKVTLQSTESLEDALRVVGALYGVRLVVAEDDQDPKRVAAPEPTQLVEQIPADEPAEAGKPRSRRRATTAKGSRSDNSALRRGGKERTEQTTTSGSLSVPSNAELRSWARDNGLTVSDRGRISASVQSAYREAHGQ